MNKKGLVLALAVLASPALAQQDAAEGTPVSQCLALCVVGALKAVSSTPCANRRLSQGFDNCLGGEQCPEAEQVSLP